MTFPHSHKTVFVLDRSPFFLHASKEPIEFDVFSKSRTPAFIPLAPIVKTLWTCNVEASLEYARIVYDIFPENKHISFITSDNEAKVVNSWEQNEQSLQHLMTGLALVGPPDPNMDQDECTVVHGITQAMDILCEPTSTQHTVRTSLTDMASLLVNRGRIICLTHIKSEDHVRMLEECAVEALTQHNKLAASTDTLMQIGHCELILLHLTSVGGDSHIAHKPKTDVSSTLSSEVHVSQSGHYIAAKLVELVMTNYDLASTTITGIPMKEEQNASSSANYDVELLHSKLAHTELSKAGYVESLIMPSKECLYTNTITLKWCTPKSNSVELHHCTGAYRITPVDVNSRPSSCLTNFLLNGRAVMLEQPRKAGSKVMSHMLASHGGEIYIHVLNTSRSMLEDPPSISEGCGGRVTDYRINDFGELMKDCRLAPVSVSSNPEELPINRAKAQLERMTRVWPLVISDTIIFNMLAQLDPLPTLIVKENLDEDDVLECKKVIYHVVGMETKNEPLPVPATGTRGKGPKREEQYRQLWSELERLIRAHESTSPNHVKILDCLLECKRPTAESLSPKKLPGKQTPTREDTSEADQSWKELERYQKLTERERTDLNQGEPRSFDEPPAKKTKPLEPLRNKATGGQSLLSLWTSRVSAMHNLRRSEFTGREDSTSSKAELYKHLNEENGDAPMTETQAKK